MHLPRPASTTVTEVVAVIYHALVYSRVGAFLVEELLFEEEGGWIEIIQVCNTAGETIKSHPHGY